MCRVRVLLTVSRSKTNNLKTIIFHANLYLTERHSYAMLPFAHNTYYVLFTDFDVNLIRT